MVHVVLSLRELVYIDRYLDRFREGLAYHPIFRRIDTLHALAETGEVTFLLGTKPEGEGEGERQNISHWDTLGMAEIQRGLNSAETHIRINLQDVPLQPSAEKTRSLLNEGNLRELLGEGGPSLVIIGSSRINPAAEAALAIMLGLKPFEDIALAARRKQPFSFVWNEDRPYVYKSALHLSSANIAADYAVAARQVDDDEASALSIRGEVYLDELSCEGFGSTYGICAVQRRSNGKVWVVLSGLTGVSTYVASKQIAQLSNGLNEPHTGRNSPIY